MNTIGEYSDDHCMVNGDDEKQLSAKLMRVSTGCTKSRSPPRPRSCTRRN